MDRHGDLGASWEAAPRYLFVWEGLLARLPADKVAAERRWLKLKRWERAFRCWEWDPIIRHAISDAAYRRHIMIDILITHPRPFADLVVEYLDQSFYEYHRLLFRSLSELEGMLPHMPEVSMVLHSEERQPFLFGARGRLVETVGDVTRG